MFWIWSIYIGVAHKVSHPPPEPEHNLKVPPPVAVPGADDEDGEDVSGPTVEVHVELAKTVGKLLNITIITDHWYIPVAQQVDPGQMPTLLHSSTYWIKSTYIHWLLLHSMHLVICAVQVACVVSTSMLSLPGGVTNLNTTAFLSTPMNMHLVYLDWMLLGQNYFSWLLWTTKSIPVLLFTGIL